MHVTEPAVRPRSSSPLFRGVIVILILLLIGFLAFDYWFYRAVRASLPQRDGTVRLAGLTAPVIVTYDSLGVPNISASTIADLFFAQGYVTAQDRLWQMDMTRRFASGDLAVVLGPEYVKYDRENRILGLRQAAQRSAANMDPQQRAQFEAYAAGVNAYIVQHQKTLPMEFRFLQYFPHAWTVEDSVLVGLSMTEFLNHGLYKRKLEKEKILAKLGPELTADLFVNRSWRDHPPGAEDHSIEQEIPGETAPEEEEEKSAVPQVRVLPLDANLGPLANAQDSPKDGRIWGTTAFGQEKTSFRDIPALRGPERLNYPNDPVRPGSNNWVISGEHTASGKPLLSNDMHLDLAIPNTWYEAHLTAADFDVAGVTLPGVPYVIVGHNRRIAWGFTNLGPNVEDVYVEKFNDRGEYLTPQGWKQPEHRKEIIRVESKPEIDIDVVTTRHGPIISDLVPGEQRKLALKWAIYDPQAWRIPFFAVDAAQNWQEFRAAFSQFTAPAQNVVYADVDGHIGYQATGLIPIRATGDGDVPEPGDDNAHEWTGYVPYDKLPSVYDPPSGVIATANGRTTPDNYPYELSIGWVAPYRTQRIYKLLSAPKKFTPSDMLSMQMDVVSTFDRFCAERFVYAVDHTAKASARARTAADLMRKWDGTMDKDSAAPTIAMFSRKKLEELLLRPKLGDQWRDYQWFMSSVWLENVLQNQPSRWLPPGYSDYDQLLTAAVEGAISNAGATRPLTLWKWGRVHQVDIKHPFWSHFPVLKRTAGTGKVPMSGDEETVMQEAPPLGPSERLTVDFANLDGSTLDIVNGESGDIFDPHFNDQWDAYYHGHTFSLPFSAEAVQRAAEHHLRLVPQ
ncbi:MAG TPA: penicillin acylase family protein [Terriglobales bacterium]|nr:penicillin acylase family protein [Terriglobales bacterium]